MHYFLRGFGPIWLDYGDKVFNQLNNWKCFFTRVIMGHFLMKARDRKHLKELEIKQRTKMYSHRRAEMYSPRSMCTVSECRGAGCIQFYNDVRK